MKINYFEYFIDNFYLGIIYSVIKKPIYQGSFQIVISEQKSNGSIIEKLQEIIHYYHHLI